jgi:hypothetical protein
MTHRFIWLLTLLPGLLSVLMAASGATVDHSAPSSVYVTEETPASVELVFELAGLETEERALQAGTFQMIHIQGMSATTEPGRPALPQRAYFVRVPLEGQVRLEILETEEEERDLGRPYPAQPPQYRSGIGAEYRYDADFYAVGDGFPESYARLGDAAILRGIRVVPVILTPVRYFPREAVCRVAVRLRLRLVAQARLQGANSLDSDRARTRGDDQFYASAVINPPAGFQGDDSEPKLIVVCADAFLSVIQPFVGYKRAIGIPTQVVPLSSIGWSASEVREYLQEIFVSQAIPPEAVLLVGDVGFLPTFFGVNGSLTDHPYSALAGHDYLPDIAVGRVPCPDVESCRRWVARTLAYEQNPPTDDAWAQSAVVFSSSDFLDPLNGQIAAALFETAGFTSVAQLQQPQTGTLPLFLESLNAACSWLFYIGHGFAEGFSSVSPHFTISELDQLDTPEKTPFVISVACATADLDWPGQSLSETWLSLPEDLGAVAYFGATESTAFFYSDTIGLGTLRGFLEYGLPTIGQAVNFGKTYMAAAFPQGPGGLTEETMQQFILLGDPTLAIYTETPQQLEITCPTQLPLSAPILPVTVRRMGHPCSGARLCLRSGAPFFYAVEYTGENGQAQIPLMFESPIRLDLAITAKNSRPYFSTVDLIPDSGAYVVAAMITVADPEGDGDSLADRGETVSLGLQLVNYGRQTSVPGEFRFQSADSFLSIDTSAVAFPSIAPGDTKTTWAGASEEVSAQAPDGHETLVRADLAFPGQPAQTTYLPILLHAPVFGLPVIALEEDSGDGDGRPEAGERVRLCLSWINEGMDDAHDLRINLRAQDGFLSIRDSVCEVSQCGVGGTLSAEYVLIVSPSTPRGYSYCFDWSLSGGNIATESATGCVRVGRIPVLIWERDPTPANVNGLVAAIEALGVELDRTTVLPLDLPRFESIFAFLGIFPNNEPLSQEDGALLAAYLDDGGALYLEGGDTWAFDPPTSVHPYFHVEGLTDGSGNAGPIAGEIATDFEGMRFGYNGENNYIDRLSALDGAQVWLRNSRGTSCFPVCIAYAGTSYRTVGSSVELGALVDSLPPSTRVQLVRNLLQWFGVEFGGDVSGPAIVHYPLHDTHNSAGPYVVHAELHDMSEVGGGTVFCETNSGGAVELEMSRQGGIWQAAIPGQPQGTIIYYHVEAWDAVIPPNRTVSTEWHFRILPPTPRLLYECFDAGNISPSDWQVIRSDERSSVCIRPYGERENVLEIGDSPDSDVCVVTPTFDASLYHDITLRFWHYLRGSCCTREMRAIITGSTDGGMTFPHMVWETWARQYGILEEGVVASVPLRWAAGHDSVALKFCYNGDFYWRLDDIVIQGVTLSDAGFVDGVCIHYDQGKIRLYWPPEPGASHYVIYAGESAENGQTMEPIATTDTTCYTGDLAGHSRRFYRVKACYDPTLLSSHSSPIDTATVQPARIRPEDLRWIHKLETIR